MTPGRINGKMTRRKVVNGGAPKLTAAWVSERSKPARVAVTVMMTKGIPNMAWARMMPA